MTQAKLQAEASEWAGLRRTIEALQTRVAKEIQAYPAPIPACDAQFNHLLDLRRLLPEECARLDAAVRTEGQTVAGFIEASPCKEALLAPDPPTPAG